MFREIAFCVVAGFRHVTAQAGQVLGDDHVGLAGFEVLQHSLEAGPLKVAAGKSVVHELLHQDDAILFAVLPDDGALVGNTGRFTVLPLLIGKAVVGVCKLNVVPHVFSFPEPLIYGSIIPYPGPVRQNLRPASQ